MPRPCDPEAFYVAFAALALFAAAAAIRFAACPLVGGSDAPGALPAAGSAPSVLMVGQSAVAMRSVAVRMAAVAVLEIGMVAADACTAESAAAEGKGQRAEGGTSSSGGFLQYRQEDHGNEVELGWSCDPMAAFAS